MSAIQSGISILTPECQTTMGGAVSGASVSVDAQCGCFCAKTLPEVVQAITEDPSCSATEGSTLTVLELIQFCFYGVCPCSTSPRASSITGITSCQCLEASPSFTPCSPTCTTASDCPPGFTCSTSSSRRKLGSRRPFFPKASAKA